MAGHLSVPQPAVQATITRIHYAYPIVLLAIFAVAFIAQSVNDAPKDTKLEVAKGIHGPGGKPLPKTKKRGPSAQREILDHDFSPAKKAVFNWLSIGVILSFFATATATIVHALSENKGTQWWCGEHVAIYAIGSVTIFSLILVSLIDSVPSPTWAHACGWSVALLMELILLGASTALYSGPHRQPSSRDRADPATGEIRYYGHIVNHITTWEALELGIDLARVVLLVTLLSFWTVFSWRRAKDIKARQAAEHDPEETTHLLNGHASKHANGIEYGTVSNGHAYTNGHPKTYTTESHCEEEHEEEGWKRPEKLPSRSWYEYIRGYTLFFPYLWPARSRKLKLAVVICFILVLVQRVVNIVVPQVLGLLVEAITDQHGMREIPWQLIGLYVSLRALQGSDGLVGALRTLLWIPVSQYSNRELSTAAFEHVHSLSLDFHLGKKTGEVVSALNKGNSINNFLEKLTFDMVPMLVDLVLVIYIFLVKYDAYYALVLFIMTIVYLYLTIRMSRRRSDMRREQVKLDRAQEAIKFDSLTAYDSVKYFNAEEREFKKYRNAIKAFQKAEIVVLYCLQTLSVAQMAVFAIALLIVAYIAAYQVTVGDLDIKDFIELITYMNQLQAPLTYFGQFYRQIQTSMINAERLLELFKEQPTVIDEPDAQELIECNGEIQCNDIEFAYDARHPALKGVTFRCAPGTTTALVGESGGGKSTMFRLLYRFYDLAGGNIEVDGHDVRDLTIDSLRKHIGVVPQDTVLFNDTVMYNLRYANPDASDEDVYAAAKAASIHEKILGFPDGYDTMVGERGLKLSGGEKQRVAIARTILKNPRIILLDEATAALDSDTEHNIQEALRTLTENRTTLVIAHRLSTITTADQILVLQDGKIAEAGPHHELMERNGRYATMWKKQMRAQRVADEARYLTNKAKRLREEVDDSASASQSEDERTGSSTAKSIADKKGHRKQISSLAFTTRDSSSRDGDSLDNE